MEKNYALKRKFGKKEVKQNEINVKINPRIQK